MSVAEPLSSVPRSEVSRLPVDDPADAAEFSGFDMPCPRPLRSELLAPLHEAKSIVAAMKQADKKFFFMFMSLKNRLQSLSLQPRYTIVSDGKAENTA